MITEQVRKDAQTAFIRARIQLLQSKPFYAHLVMKMPLVWMEDVPGGISCTDGDSIFINPETFITLEKPEQVSVLVHEVLHCAAGHLFRRGAREPMKWNVAGDVYIANLIEAEGFTPIAGAEKFLQNYGINRETFRQCTTDEIFAKIPDPPKQKQGGGKGKGKGKGQGQGNEQQQGQGPGQHWQGEGGCYHEAKDSSKRSEAESRWKQNVIEAGQMAGNSPGHWHELVKAAMPRPPFTLKLHEYLSRGMGGDTSWDSLNRRYLWQGLYLPNDTKIVMGEVACFIDTSGSMCSAQLQLGLGYVRAFREQHPCKMHVVQCDHDCIDAAQYKAYDEYERLPETFKVIGRGGTSFDPPFKLLREKRIEPKVAIYFTDGYGACHETKRPSYPVLWVVIRGDQGFKPPFGEVVYVKGE